VCARPHAAVPKGAVVRMDAHYVLALCALPLDSVSLMSIIISATTTSFGMVHTCGKRTFSELVDSAHISLIISLDRDTHCSRSSHSFCCKCPKVCTQSGLYRPPEGYRYAMLLPPSG
jgi:hypothetical protein